MDSSLHKENTDIDYRSVGKFLPLCWELVDKGHTLVYTEHGIWAEKNNVTFKFETDSQIQAYLWGLEYGRKWSL